MPLSNSIQTTYHDRHAFQIDNDQIRVTVLAEGGHIAGLLYKKTGVNPLWLPPWQSIEPRRTQFLVTATKSRAIVETADHDWPQLYPGAEPSAYAAHLMDPAKPQAHFIAWSPNSLVAIAYVWQRADFPWLGIWQEN